MLSVSKENSFLRAEISSLLSISVPRAKKGCIVHAIEEWKGRKGKGKRKTQEQEWKKLPETYYSSNVITFPIILLTLPKLIFDK